MSATPQLRDYTINAETIRRTDEAGLGSADWYKTPIPRKALKELMQRRDGPAIRDTAIWAAGLIVSGVAGYLTWGRGGPCPASSSTAWLWQGDGFTLAECGPGPRSRRRG